MSSRTYDNITPAIWACVKETSNQEHGTTYTGPDQGTATTQIPIVGTLVMSYDFQASAGTLTYAIVKKPGLAPESRIWGGIESTIDGCRSSA
jgi:hypothetical protein